MIRSDNLKFLCPLAAILALAWSNPAPAQVVYGVSGNGGAASTLYAESYAPGTTLSVGAGSAFTSVGNVTLTTGGTSYALSLSGIAYVNGTLYGVTNSMTGSVNLGPSGANYSNSLVTINMSTGAATLVAGNGTLANPSNLGTSAQVQSLAYDSSTNSLYGFSKSGVGSSPVSNSLVLINTSTGLASQVGSGTGITQTTMGNGMAFDSSGNGYLAPFALTSPTNGAMYSVNASSGAATSSGLGFSNVPISGSNMKAMAFDGTGLLYGLDFGGGSTDLVLLTNTGSSWSMMNSSWSMMNLGTTPTAFVGIAFVPEPSSFVLVGLATTVIGLSCWARRRRAKLAAASDCPIQI
jgi:hypothetical protein